MDETGVVGWIASGGAAIWTGFFLLCIWLVRTAPHWKHRVNEARQILAGERANDWTRLREEINRLDKRCDGLQVEVDGCREREAEWMGRAIKAEAVLEGEGEARQNAQRMLSEERREDRNEREGKKK